MDSLENNLSSVTSIKLNCRGDIIDVPKYCIKKIPLLDAIEESKFKETVTLDLISPRFLQLIVDYTKNDQKTEHLRKILTDEFDDDVIKIYLKYLGMNIVFDELYKPSIPPLNDPYEQFMPLQYDYRNDRHYRRCNSRDAKYRLSKKSSRKK